jgi:restriction system protein
MARRSKRNKSKELAQLIVATIFLLAWALSGGDLTRAAALIPVLLFSGLILGCIGLLLNILFRTSGGTGYHPGVSRNFTYQASVGSVSDSAPAPPERVIPQRCTQELLNLMEWRRFELLVQALFQAEGKIASRIRAGADGGIDLALRESPEGPVTAIVQCKAWKAYTVGVYSEPAHPAIQRCCGEPANTVNSGAVVLIPVANKRSTFESPDPSIQTLLRCARNPGGNVSTRAF